MVSLAAYDQYRQTYYRGDLTEIFIIHIKTRVSMPLSLLKYAYMFLKQECYYGFFFMCSCGPNSNTVCVQSEDLVLSII